jgi:hypothetical protein
MYLRFTLSFRDVEELLAERGIAVTTRPSGAGSSPLARQSHDGCGRNARGHMAAGTSMRCSFVWVATDVSVAGVDAEGEVLDVLLQPKRDTKAARKLMQKLLKRQAMAPDEWVTDKNPAYGAALRALKLTRIPHTRRKRATTEPKARMSRYGDESGSYRGSSRPDQLSVPVPYTRPPTRLHRSPPPHHRSHAPALPSRSV